MQSAADQLGIDAEQGLDTLAREDLVHRGGDGESTVAYPFSGRPTAHRVRFPGGHEVDPMCAIDALGIAPMFETHIEVESRDPVSGEAIRAQVEPDGAAEWSPASAVVVAGAIRDQGDACRGCCPVLNFFASTATAECWLAEHPEVRGTVISIREASAAGRAALSWWTTQADVADGPAAVLRLRFPDAPISWDLRVEEAAENERLRWHCVGGPPPWVDTDIVFRLAATPEVGTRVLFDHVGWKDAEEMVRIVTFGWVQMFLRLKGYAESGKPQPYFDF